MAHLSISSGDNRCAPNPSQSPPPPPLPKTANLKPFNSSAAYTSAERFPALEPGHFHADFDRSEFDQQ
ncbi:hypothetical protein MMC31_001820, partial [Peltigera leucophlebia]|nr:hypothetical protein [Peltigera leucophlebia]